MLSLAILVPANVFLAVAPHMWWPWVSLCMIATLDVLVSDTIQREFLFHYKHLNALGKILLSFFLFRDEYKFITDYSCSELYKTIILFWLVWF